MKSEREREAKEFKATEEEAQNSNDAEKTEPLLLRILQERKRIEVVETVGYRNIAAALEKMQNSSFIGLWKPTVAIRGSETSMVLSPDQNF